MITSRYQAQITPQFTFWTQDECQRFHLATLEVLEKTGVMVYEKEAQSLLKEAGCLVKENRVKIPAALIQWALDGPPERVVLANTRGERKIFLEEGMVSYGMGNDLAYFHPPQGGEIRRALLSDVQNAALVASRLEHIDFIASMALASDVPKGLEDLYHFQAMRWGCEKPLLASAIDRPVLERLLEMALVGVSLEEFQQNPTFAVYGEPTSPLIHSQEAVEKLLFAAQHKIPITYASGVMSGATGPVTLAGSLVVGNAEALSGLLMHQLKKRGAPFIYGIVAAPMDMKSTICLYGGPEVPLLHMVVGEMGRFYQLPSYGISGCSDSCLLDLQAGLESTFSITAAAWSGTNLVHDNGYLGSGLIGSLEHLIMTHEVIGMVKHFMKGVAVNEETVPLDLIHSVGPGGHFLLADHTREHFRKETWYPQFMNRAHFPDWEKRDRRTMEERLRENLQEILALERNGVSEKELQEMDRIILAEKKRREVKR